MNKLVTTGLLAFLLFGCGATLPWRASPPAPPELQPRSELIPEVHSSTGAEGLTVLVARRAYAPLVSVQLAFLAGHAEDPADKEGLAAMSFTLLAEHAHTLVSADSQDSCFGASELPELVVDPDGARIGATVLPEDMDRLLSRLASALSTFSVDEESLLRAKRGGAAVAKGSSGRSFAAESTVARVILGRDDELARRAEGSAISRGRIGVADVEAFIATHARPDAMAVVVAGPADSVEVAMMVDRHFGAWASTRCRDGACDTARVAPVAVHPRPGGLDAARLEPLRAQGSRASAPVLRISSSGAPRLVVAMGSFGAPSGASEEALLRLAEQALGGALRFHLRDLSQLSYQVGHSLTLHRHGGLLSAFASMEPEDVPRATASARRALAQAPEWLRPSSGMESVRRAALFGLMDELDTVCGLAAASARTFQRGLPPSHYKDVARAIETTPGDRATDMLRKLVHPDAARILLIGAI